MTIEANTLSQVSGTLTIAVADGQVTSCWPRATVFSPAQKMWTSWFSSTARLRL